MARTIEQVKTSIIADMALYPELTTLLANTSKRSIWYLFIFVISAAIVIFEQLLDVFKSDVETNISKAASATPLWLQDKIFKFQYSASDPQIVKLDTITFAPTYDVISPELQIVKRASINTTVSNYVTIKVAKQPNDVLIPLEPLETASLQGYVTTIGAAGINYVVTSTPANQMFWNVDIIYDAQFASVIETNIIAATNAYLLNIPFDGIFRVNKLEQYIMNNVLGVIDLVTNNLSIREDSQTIAEGIALVVDGDVVKGSLNPTSGFIIPETTVGFMLSDNINLIVN